MEGTHFLTILGIWRFLGGFVFLPIVLYAETHYRFKYFFSILRKREPEIIADAPHRLDPNCDLPLLIFVKDADQFPCELIEIAVTLSDNAVSERIVLFSGTCSLSDRFWHQIYHMPTGQFRGFIESDVEFSIRINGSIKKYHNDNYRTSSHKPLRTYISADKLPQFDNLYFGEIHSHSNYTSDQVEYGSPPGASVELCKPMGISFFCITDHSYDLDDSLDNYLEFDSSFPKWKALDSEVLELNENAENFIVIKGEEVSCRNRSGQNVHFLLLGNERFLEGSGDSAERWLQTKSEHSINDVLDLKEPESVSIAAHPFERVSLLQRILLRRGKWQKNDFEDTRLQGIQFINGALTHGFEEGYEFWKKRLLSGEKLFLCAGNDAHGNFNRFRQIGIPFLLIREHGDQLFGKMRTGIYTLDFTQKGILSALKNGHSIAADGPAANFTEKNSETSIIGSDISAEAKNFSMSAVSTPEYGTLKHVKILAGVTGETLEKIIFSSDSLNEYSFRQDFEFSTGRRAYIRAEIWTNPYNSSDKKSHFCLTNPFWVIK
jgi:hypothetical protein